MNFNEFNETPRWSARARAKDNNYYAINNHGNLKTLFES
jgi:hypothetical protein